MLCFYLCLGSFIGGVVVARVWWNALIAKAKALESKL